jgi:cysteinyl-tRNA synthetase
LLKLYNSLGKKLVPFQPAGKKAVAMFTCGPSVYQRAHIGNFRTFLFEDVLLRYLEFSGYTVARGMNFTDIEDKAITEAERLRTTVERITEKNIKTFLIEMKLLVMKTPDYLPKASEYIHDIVNLIQLLLKKKHAYWHHGNVYFDPLRFRGFGKLYGLDMSQWPARKRRFHKDTYPGMHWNLGDFILWHGYKKGDRYFWDTLIGRGRPSWNIQDPGIVSSYFHETLSLYCGGIDNLFRHHDYTLAVLESVRPYPMAKFWLHCHHLFVNGQKMSKSKGNILYTDMLRKLGYTMSEIRFFLIYGHYRERIDYSEEHMKSTVEKLRKFKAAVRKIEKIAKGNTATEERSHSSLKKDFRKHMDNDLHVQHAFDAVNKTISGLQPGELIPAEASGVMKGLREIDEVLKVIF